MNHTPRTAYLAGFVFALLCSTSAQGAPQEDAAALWNALARPVFDAQKAGVAEGVVLKRDIAAIELTSGTIGFAQTPGGRPFAAAFRGKGRLRVKPVRPLEVQQLWFHTRAQELDVEFTEATFLFSDNTFDEVARDVKFGTGDAGGLQGIYTGRNDSLVDRGLNWDHRALKALLSDNPQRQRLFRAELKAEGFGWVSLALDSARPEEFSLFSTEGGESRWIRTTWVQQPAGNRSVEEAYRGLEAMQDFIIERYKMDTSVTSRAELSSTTTVEMKVQHAGERALLFTLDPNLRVSEVKDSAGRAWGFFQPRDPKESPFLGEYLVVVAPGPVPAGPLTLEFRYAGKRVVRNEGAGVFFAQSYGWYPGYDDEEVTFGKYSNFDLTLRVPKKFKAVAVGRKLSEAVEGDDLVTRWESDIPQAVAGFAFGDYEVQTQQVGKVQVEVYANKNPDDLLRTIQLIGDDTMPDQNRRINPLAGLGSMSPSMLRKEMVDEMATSLKFFEQNFGPYPYSKLAISNIPSWYAYGQGWPGLIYLSALSFLDPTQRSRLGLGGYEAELTDRWRSHETSHQWWGHAVGWRSYHDQWLSEGFAEYSGMLYTFVRRGPEEFFKALRRGREYLIYSGRYGSDFHLIGPIYAGRRLQSAKYPRGYDVVVYQKGAWVLHMLRMLLYDTHNAQNPDHRFLAMMQDFVKTSYNRPASTQDFQRVVEKHMTPQMDMDGNKRMDWFFNQWVYSTGIPEYSLTYEIHPGKDPNTFLLKGMLRQSGVPAWFKMPVPLYFTRGKNTFMAGWIPAVGPETPIEVPLGFRPDKITLNEQEDILCVVKGKK